VLLVFGLLLILIANQLLGRALRTEMDQRALAIATNLSAAAAGPVMGENILELYAQLTKYAQLQGVAYAFIEDANGKIVGHSIRPFPPEIAGTLTPDERKQVGTRVVTLQGKTVFETRAPILEGQLGTTHLGIWAESVKSEINAARFRFVGLIAFALLVAVALSIFFVRVLIAPIGALVSVATDVRPSELKKPVEERVAT
jgi:nitrogen fixation/metabolism regulation signal transduction histidine kinase